MPGAGFETSLLEASFVLFKILMVLVFIAIVAAVVTLPIFYGALGYKVGWLWAADSTTTGSFPRRLWAKFCRFAMPLASLLATIISLGYFGAYDWPARMVGSVTGYGPGPTQKLFKFGINGAQATEESVKPTPSIIHSGFDGSTRWLASKLAPELPQNVKINWARCPDEAYEIIEIWDEGIIPPPEKPNPLEKLFPEYQGQVAAPMMGAIPTPPEVTKKAKQLIQAHEAGSLYSKESTREINRETMLAAQTYFDRAVKDTKASQDSLMFLLRGLGMFFLLIIGPVPLVVFMTAAIVGRRGVSLVMRSVIRALLRTSLTYLAVFVLVFVLCCVWSVLAFFSAITQQKDANFKGIITEKYQVPSQMKPSHLGTIKQLIAELPPGQRPDDIDKNIMTWAFVMTTLDPTKQTMADALFFFATEPECVLTMMPGMEELSPDELALIQQAVDTMSKNKQAVVIGAAKLRQMNKRVGDRIKASSMNYRGIDFDLEIVAEFPAGTRWEQNAVMNRKYLDEAVTNYRGEGATAVGHPLADKCMNLIWVRLPNIQAFDTLSAKINDPSKFSPAIKMEIESSAYANILSPYKTLLWFMKWPLSVGLVAITTLVASLVIGIGVRERKTEIAVLKVLGFRPWMVLGLVLGEALLVGILSGFMSTVTAFSMVNAMGGLKLPIAFFNKFYIPENALWWGPLIGGLTSLIGAVLPSISAYRIKASQVFSRVT
jgi:putative ABC transport system permease protein